MDIMAAWTAVFGMFIGGGIVILAAQWWEEFREWLLD